MKTALISLSGMNRETGEICSGEKHLRQSIKDILTTPRGSYLMDPNYGSELPRYVDKPVTKNLASTLQAEVGRAIETNEPRLKFKRATLDSVIDGRQEFIIEGEYKKHIEFKVIT